MTSYYSTYNEEYEKFLLSEEYKKYLDEIKLYKTEYEN